MPGGKEEEEVIIVEEGPAAEERTEETPMTTRRRSERKRKSTDTHSPPPAARKPPVKKSAAKKQKNMSVTRSPQKDPAPLGRPTPVLPATLGALNPDKFLLEKMTSMFGDLEKRLGSMENNLNGKITGVDSGLDAISAELRRALMRSSCRCPLRWQESQGRLMDCRRGWIVAIKSWRGDKQGSRQKIVGE